MKSLPIIVPFLVLILSETQVAAQQDPGIVIAHPGQDFELLCDVTPSGSGSIAWIIDHSGPYGVNAIQNGIATGYTAQLGSNNLIVQNITMNDDRNGSEYQCVIAIENENTMVLQPMESGNVTILYIAGVPGMVRNITAGVINDVNYVTLRLSWGEPFNNLDPIVNYTVSCSGDDACPPNFNTDNTGVVITNLTPMTTYTFSVVATNSIGSGEAGVLNYTTPGVVIIDKVSEVTVSCSPLNLIVQCTTVWNLVTQENITEYQVDYNGMIVNVNSSTTTQTFTAPSLPDGVFTGTVVVMVTAVSRYRVGPASDPAIDRIYDTSVSDAMAILSIPDVSSTLQSITVTCTIHPNSTADQCVVMAMDDDGRVISTGIAPVTNGIAIVTVNGLECGTNYTIIAGGTLNGDLVGPRSSHGHISTNPCPVCPVMTTVCHNTTVTVKESSTCESCDSNNNEAIIGAIVGVICTVIIIMVITNILVWIYCFRKRGFTSKGTSSELHKPTKDTINPAYHTITDDHCKKPVEEPVSYYEEVKKPSEVKMTPNPAYAVP